MELPYCLLLLLLPTSVAFTPTRSFATHRATTELFSAGGPPKYDKVTGLLRVETVGEGSVILHIEVADDEKLEYLPGHVLALEIEDKAGESKEAGDNEGWARGPYTVSRATDTSLDVMIKVVGKRSNLFASSPVGTPVRFGGKFHVPILDGVKKDDVKRCVFISTGVGVGPCIGAIELALKDETFPSIELYPSYRTPKESVYGDHLDSLAKANPDKFKWKPIITSLSGRISSSEEALQVTDTSPKLGIEETHYHLIGNAQLVGEWTEGLKKAGVPDERVTIEKYFNGKAPLDSKAVDNIASFVASSCK